MFASAEKLKRNWTNEIHVISVDSFILSHIHVYVCVSELVTYTAYILPYYRTSYMYSR